MKKARLEKSKANVGEDQEPRSREFKSKVQSTRSGNFGDSMLKHENYLILSWLCVWTLKW